VPSTTAWIVNGQTARPMHGELPENAMQVITEPLAIEAAAAPVDSRDEAMVEYLRSMRELVDGQRQVMLRYLGDSAPAEMRAAPVAEARIEKRATKSANAKSTIKQAVSEDVAPVSAVALTPMEALVAIVSQRTGYPTDMLDLDLDLEADLGIDSIKRIEILGLVSEKLGMKLVANGSRSQIIEELATVKTLRGIGAWLERRVLGTTSAADPKTLNAPPSLEVPPAEPTLREVDAAPVSTRAPAQRYLLEVVPIAAARPNCVTVKGKTFAIAPDSGGVAAHLSRILQERGATARIMTDGEALGDVDGMLYLGTLATESADSLKGLFSRAKDAVAGNAKWIVAATGRGGEFGRRAEAPHASAISGGANGLLKSLSKEQPGRRVHAIDLEHDADPSVSAGRIYDELLADDRRSEVGYRGDNRFALQVVSGAVRAAETSLALDASAVVLVTGGARGITAKIAIAIARRFHCKLELVGRSPLPDASEDPTFANALEITALRALLIARANGAGSTSPAAIDVMAREILAAREIRATLDAIREAGGSARYHAVDVRDADKLGAFVDAVYAEHGRIDGVVHGAGLIEDKLVHHKSHESFARVFDTKVASALTLVNKLRDDVRFIAFFSSVSGAFGNKGQSDYAAANAALDGLAHQLRITRNTRVLSVNWGPWAGAGMVRPELEAEYARRGVALIAPEDGAQRFLEELFDGSDTQVILSATSPSDLESEPAS
jgi:NAD(P)-dependent dehydrogenase (short-subunit alcohol dehydrogenase family)/acyl carrier protein